jgi:hypothetical protein
MGNQSESLLLAGPPPLQEAVSSCKLRVLLPSGDRWSADATLLAYCRGNTTTTNPAKLLKRMRKQRLATTKGIVKGVWQAGCTLSRVQWAVPGC